MKKLIAIFILFRSSYSSYAQEDYDYPFGETFKHVFDNLEELSGITYDRNDEGNYYILVEKSNYQKVYIFDNNDKLKEVVLTGNSSILALMLSPMTQNSELIAINDDGDYRHRSTNNLWKIVQVPGVKDRMAIGIAPE